MNSKVKQRDKSLDFLRIISMLLVIVIHVANYYCRRYTDISTSSYLGAVIFNALSRVSVPIFFMMSGALILGQEYNKEKYIKRVKRFLIVLIVWNVIYLLWNYFYLGENLNLLQEFVRLFFDPMKGHLWFLYAILGLYIVTPFLQNMVKNLDKKLEDLFIVLWLFFSGAMQIIKLLLPAIFHVNLTLEYPIPLIQSTYYLGYFVVGYFLYKRIKPEHKKYQRITILILILSSLITIIGTFIVSLISNKYFQGLFTYRSLFIMISSICVFYLVLVNKEKFQKIKIFEKLSPYSFGIYLFHIIPFNILIEHFKIIKINSFIGIPIYSIIVFITSIPFIYIISKIPIVKKII